MQIIPINQLKDTAKISAICNESNEPVFITKNGYGDMVIMSKFKLDVDKAEDGDTVMQRIKKKYVD